MAILLPQIMRSFQNLLPLNNRDSVVLTSRTKPRKNKTVICWLSPSPVLSSVRKFQVSKVSRSIYCHSCFIFISWFSSLGISLIPKNHAQFCAWISSTFVPELQLWSWIISTESYLTSPCTKNKVMPQFTKRLTFCISVFKNVYLF